MRLRNISSHLDGAMTRSVHQNFWAGGFLYNASRQAVLLHQRDGKTTINPHKWAFFGGSNEGGETYIECCLREFEEEIGLKLKAHELRQLREYMNIPADQYRVVFYVESEVDEAELILGEGAGFAWIELARVFDYDLSDLTRDDLRYFVRGIAGTGKMQGPRQH